MKMFIENPKITLFFPYFPLKHDLHYQREISLIFLQSSQFPYQIMPYNKGNNSSK